MREQTFRFAVRQFGPFETTVAQIWDAFCAQSGCTLRLEAVPLDLHALHDATLAAREGGNGLQRGDWDIAHISTDWIAEAHATDSLLDLAHLLRTNPPDDFPNGWTDSLLAFQRFGNSVLAVPFHDGPECLIYRKDLFESPAEQQAFYRATGQPLRPPQTWDEFRRVARFFTRPEQNLFGAAFAAFPDGHNAVFDFALQVWTHGGELVDQDGAVVVVSPAAHAGLSFYRAMLRDASAVHPKCAEFDSVKSGFALARGEIAMMVNWFGFASMCEVIPESVVKGKLDIAAIPHANDKASATLNVYWMYAIARGARHPQVAYDFLRFALSAESDKRLTLNGGTGTRKSTWHDPDVNAAVPYYHRLEALHASARTLPRIEGWAQVAEVIDRLVLAALNTDEPIATLLASAQAQIDGIQQRTPRNTT